MSVSEKYEIQNAIQIPVDIWQERCKISIGNQQEQLAHTGIQAKICWYLSKIIKIQFSTHLTLLEFLSTMRGKNFLGKSVENS